VAIRKAKMDKDSAIYLLRTAARNMKDLQSADSKAQADPKARSFSEFAAGLQKLCEGLAMALDDTTKAHGSLALDQAYKSFYGIGSAKDSPSDYALLSIGCQGIAGAMKWLYFSKAPAKPW
jgi:hypothetical protein